MTISLRNNWVFKPICRFLGALIMLHIWGIAAADAQVLGDADKIEKLYTIRSQQIPLLEDC